MSGSTSPMCFKERLPASLKCEDGVLRDGNRYILPACSEPLNRPDDDVLTTELSDNSSASVANVSPSPAGGAQGGHYLSYIRVDERWYEFNDADIKEVKPGREREGEVTVTGQVAEEVVLNTCGCDESVGTWKMRWNEGSPERDVGGAGAVKRMKAGTAYMLVYSREAAKGLRDVKVPEMMKERIDLANRKLREARLADEEKKNVVFCTLRGKVRDLDIDRKVQLSKKMTVRREMFDSKENLQHNVRLRQWDSFALVPHRHIPWTFDDSDNFAEKTLMDLMNDSGRDVL
eukprot:760476-Hanusia_phi.AAC.1